MTRETLNKIAKAKGVNPEYFTHVTAFVNQRNTAVHVTFSILDESPRYRQYICQKLVTLSVPALLKRGEDPGEYTTQGWTAIDELK